MSALERFKLDGKVAIVTGASRGIGASIAHALAESGAHVVVSSRKLPAVEQVAREIEAAGGRAHAVECHVGDDVALQRLVDETVATFGGVDILVNNAATNPVFGGLTETDGAAFTKIMDVNVRAPFELSKRVLPHMEKRGGGSLIHISSIGGISPEPMLGIYSVSKAALLSLTRVMAKEWGAYGVRANAICPGLVKTKFSRAIWENEDLAREVVASQPIARMAEPDEIAPLALFLASPASSYVTGAVYTIDGGHTI